MRENRTHGSEGGEDGVLSYPYFIMKNESYIKFDKDTGDLQVANVSSENNYPYPPEYNYFFWAKNVEQHNNKVTGELVFPEWGHFEYFGTMEDMFKLMKRKIAAAGIFAIPGFSGYRGN